MHVLLDCALRDSHLAGDACHGGLLSHHSQHLPLPRAENGRQIVAFTAGLQLSFVFHLVGRAFVRDREGSPDVAELRR